MLFIFPNCSFICFPNTYTVIVPHTFSNHILHALLKKGISACFADDEVSPLHHHNANEEGCVTSELYYLALLVGLKKTEISSTVLLEIFKYACVFVHNLDNLCVVVDK